METTCRLVSPSRGIEDEAVWRPHAASFPLLPAALKTRWCGVHTPPRLPSFLGHRRRGGVESTRRLVPPLSWGIEDEAVWSPHAASFPLFPGASKTRRCGVHTPPRFPSSHRRRGGSSKTRRRGAHKPPRFPSSLRHRGRGGVEPTRRPRFPSSPRHRRQGGMKPTRRLVSFPSRSVNLVSAPFTFFCLYLELPSFHYVMADSCSIKYIIVLPYHECYR
jgi:hypothetical protein